MALEIKRLPGGGLRLCAPVCATLTPADVALLDRTARAWHDGMHASRRPGSAVTDIGDDEEDEDEDRPARSGRDPLWLMKKLGRGASRGIERGAELTVSSLFPRRR